jgi:hypothetical protein
VLAQHRYGDGGHDVAVQGIQFRAARFELGQIFRGDALGLALVGIRKLRA